MQVGTYPTRNFATLGPLWLQPPFTETYQQTDITQNIVSFFSTGQASDPILHYKNLAESCVFNKQSLPSVLFHLNGLPTLRHSISRSYGVILPSSFNIVHSIALISSISLPVAVLIRYTISEFFQEPVAFTVLFYDDTTKLVTLQLKAP